MSDNESAAAAALIEMAYDHAFYALVDDSLGISNVPDSSRTKTDNGLELHAPSFEFFDLLSWSVALSVLSAASVVVLQRFSYGRPTVLNAEEVEQIKNDLTTALDRGTWRTGSVAGSDAEASDNAIAYASRILVSHGWPAEQAQLILRSMLHEYETRLRVLNDSPDVVEAKVQPKDAHMMKILFLGANPTDTTQLALTREVQAIRSRLRSSEHGSQFQVEQEWAVRLSDLNAALLRHRPDIVHFSGHGSTAGKLILENDSGESVVVKPEALTNLFRILKRNIRCVVLNACFSAPQAEAIAEHIDFVVGMTDAVSDESAVAFAWAFYEALAFNTSVQDAFDLGCNQVDINYLPDKDVPRLISRDGLKPQAVFLIDPK